MRFFELPIYVFLLALYIKYKYQIWPQQMLMKRLDSSLVVKKCIFLTYYLSYYDTAMWMESEYH